MELRSVSIHGHRIAYHRAGDGPVLLLVHGMAGTARQWRHVFASLAERFTVVAPDMLGHGESAKPEAEYNLSAHANVLRDLLVALGHERATLVGQSYGGGVAMQLAYQAPELCERMVLVSSGGLGREVSPLLRGLSVPGVEQLFPLVCSPLLRDLGERVGAFLADFELQRSPAGEEIWRSYAGLADAETRRAFFRTLRAVIDHRGQSVSAADRLYLTEHIPTLVVWGADDAIIPVQHGYDAVRALPGSRLELFDGVGHFPHCERPDRFAAVVTDFVEATMPAQFCRQRFSSLIRDQQAEPLRDAG